MKHNFWVSGRKFTFWILVDDNDKLVDTAPIAKKFISQPVKNLLRYFNIDQLEKID
jgi:hypothetical protein